MMTEKTPAPRRIPIGEPPSSTAQKKWSDVERRTRSLDAQLLKSSLLYDCLGMMQHFALKHGVQIEPMPPELETRFVNAVDEFAALRRAVRNVEDRLWGARWTGKDFDVIEPGQSLEGLFIPVAIGAGVLAFGGLMARLFYLENETDEINAKYNALIETTDRQFCADPSSPLCSEWQIEKEVSGYQKNKTFADSIKSAAVTVGSGLGKGLMIALPVLALAFVWGRR